MWPFKSGRSFDDDDGGWEDKAVPLSTLARWYMYDMDVQDANKLAVALDLTPVSEEGDEKERQDSDDRIDRISGLIPFFNTMANINAEAVFQVQRQELPPEMKEMLANPTPELMQLVKFYEGLSFAAILSSFSSAAELGLIKLTGNVLSKE